MLTRTPKCVGYIVSTHVLSRKHRYCHKNNILHDGAIHGEIINEVWYRFCMYMHMK